MPKVFEIKKLQATPNNNKEVNEIFNRVKKM